MHAKRQRGEKHLSLVENPMRSIDGIGRMALRLSDVRQLELQLLNCLTWFYSQINRLSMKTYRD